MPLGLALGWMIAPDGRVFNARTGREAAQMSLRDARRQARKCILHDPARALGGGAEPLVGEDVVAMRFRQGSAEGVAVWGAVVRWVRIEPPDGLCLDIGPDGAPAWRRDRADGRIEWVEDSPDLMRPKIVGGHHPAHGDTARGWVNVSADASDPGCRACLIMHGPSVARAMSE